MFYAFQFYHFSKRETEPALLFRVYSWRLDHRITGLLAYSLSLTVNLDDRSAGRRSCWVWVKQPWPHFCWIRLMLQTGYRDPFPAVARHAGCAPLSRTAVEAKSIKTSAVGDSFYTSDAPFLHISERFTGHECAITIFFKKKTKTNSQLQYSEKFLCPWKKWKQTCWKCSWCHFSWSHLSAMSLLS